MQQGGRIAGRAATADYHRPDFLLTSAGLPSGMKPAAMPQAQFVGLLALMLAVPPALYWLALLDERRRQPKRAATAATATSATAAAPPSS